MASFIFRVLRGIFRSTPTVDERTEREQQARERERIEHERIDRDRERERVQREVEREGHHIEGGGPRDLD